MKIDYLVQWLRETDIVDIVWYQAELNKLGIQGWELVDTSNKTFRGIAHIFIRKS